MSEIGARLAIAGSLSAGALENACYTGSNPPPMQFPNRHTPDGLYSLVTAIAGQEITTREFSIALETLPAEPIQFVGTILGLQASLRSTPCERLSTARAFCRADASAKRSLC
jgi:hypothetical protein